MLYSLVICTLPCLVALAAMAFIAIERASVDPTISAGAQGVSPVPVWSAPLAIFAVMHCLALLFASARVTPAGMIAGVGAVAAMACFFYFAGPVVVSETVFGVFFVVLVITLVGVILWPIAGACAVAVCGALFGLSIYLPLALAQRLGNGDYIRPSVKPLVLAGVLTAIVYALVFGLPTWATMAARGNYSFPRESAGDIWNAHAPIIAGCCVVLALAGAWTFGSGIRTTAWLLACALPVAVLVATVAPVLKATENPFAHSSLRQLPPFSTFSRFARDGRPRAVDPIVLSGLELTIDRALVRYQLADNPTRQISTVALRPSPESTALGVRGTIILNAWRPVSARQEAEGKGAVCAANAARGPIECRYPSYPQPALEIDADNPSRWLERRDCTLILAELGGARLHARVELDCATASTWPMQAASIAVVLNQILRRR